MRIHGLLDWGHQMAMTDKQRARAKEITEMRHLGIFRSMTRIVPERHAVAHFNTDNSIKLASNVNITSFDIKSLTIEQLNDHLVKACEKERGGKGKIQDGQQIY